MAFDEIRLIGDGPRNRPCCALYEEERVSMSRRGCIRCSRADGGVTARSGRPTMSLVGNGRGSRAYECLCACFASASSASASSASAFLLGAIRVRECGASLCERFAPRVRSTRPSGFRTAVDPWSAEHRGRRPRHWTRRSRALNETGPSRPRDESTSRREGESGSGVPPVPPGDAHRADFMRPDERERDWMTETHAPPRAGGAVLAGRRRGSSAGLCCAFASPGRCARRTAPGERSRRAPSRVDPPRPEGTSLVAAQ
ncbi:uncharacterized protein CMC5_066450 [Chondromyces crocatus]|uniref:Uncharacterized protein n=1 Tax=Chondromyces crocatus TaxID=52 RepID=A0A0K1ENK7_CHOCO|nr:uncharacterized protein CMC5_066450 [Chondromyces crocatus]